MEVESLAAASYKDSNSLSKKKCLQLKQGSQANFVHVFCTFRRNNYFLILWKLPSILLIYINLIYIT